jgi:hypothetical protein
MKKMFMPSIVAGVFIAATAQAMVRLPDVSLVPDTLNVAPGSTVNVSVDLSYWPGFTMTAISTDIVYDENVFTYVDPSVVQGAFLTHNWDLLGAQTATLRVGGFDSDGGEALATGSGTLFTFTLQVNAGALPGAYALNWGNAGNGVGFDYGDADFQDVLLPSSDVSINVVPVPEPGTFALMVCGLTGLLVMRRRSA